MTDSEVSGYFTGLATAWIREHPHAAVKLFFKKLALTFNARHQWLEARDRFGDHWTLADERENLFWPLRRRQRPEPRADTAGEDYGPEFLIEWRLRDRSALFSGRGSECRTGSGGC